MTKPSPVYDCQFCSDATGYYHSQEGMRCLTCQSLAKPIEPILAPLALHSVQQVVELERMVSL